MIGIPLRRVPMIVEDMLRHMKHASKAMVLFVADETLRFMVVGIAALFREVAHDIASVQSGCEILATAKA